MVSESVLELASPRPGEEVSSRLRVAGTFGGAPGAVTHVEVRLDGTLAAVVRPADGGFAHTLPADELAGGSHVVTVTAFTERGERVTVERDVVCRGPAALRRPQAPGLRVIARYVDVASGDWTSVARARPLFAGHAQPHVPADLGFTDRRIEATRAAQADLAARYGIDAFCYPLGGPCDAVASFPFCLSLDGGSEPAGAAHAGARLRDVLARFADARYVHVEGRPLFVVERPDGVARARETFADWRAACIDAGAGNPFVLLVQRGPDDDPTPYGFDGALEVPPWSLRPAPLAVAVASNGVPRAERFAFEDLRDAARRRDTPPYPLFRGVVPGWDETPRRLTAPAVFDDASPEGYRRWLDDACAWTARAHPPGRQLVFVNAWNDWTRGAHLEPDVRYGRLHLEATADVVAAHRAPAARSRAEPVVSVIVPCRDHERYVAAALASALDQTLDALEVVVVDDGSRDETVAAVQELVRERRDTRVRMVAQRNLGAHAALNAGLARARGRYVAILNSDDRYAVDRLEIMTGALEAHDADFAFSEVAYVDASGRDITFGGGVASRYLLKQAAVATFPELAYALLDFNVTISTGNFVFRRSLYEAIGGFKPLLYCHDWDFALRAVRAGKIVYVDRSLYEYRFHAGNAHHLYDALAAYEGRIVMEDFFGDRAYVSALRARDPEYYRRFLGAHALAGMTAP